MKRHAIAILGEAPPLHGRRSREGAFRSLKRAARVPAVMTSSSVTLGIDLGTTSVKAALVEAAPGDPNGFVILASCTRAARAEAATQCAAAGPQVRQRPGAAPPSRPPTSPGGPPPCIRCLDCPSAAVPFPGGARLLADTSRPTYWPLSGELCSLHKHA